MSRSLAGVERILERLIERPTTRLFRARIQPAQLLRRIERTMDAGRLRDSDRWWVPHRYCVLLSPGDLAALEPERAALEAALADDLARHARERGRYLLTDVEVVLGGTPTLGLGDIDVVAEPLDPSLVHAAAAGLRPVELARPSTPGAMTPRPGPAAVVTALIEVRPAGGAPFSFQFVGTAVGVGRGPDNAISLDDPRVSRHHGRFVARRGTLVYVDAGSSNGSYVNGTRQREIALGAGDVVRVGHSTLTIRARP
jgi:hypothetical protein